jgi:hypothetical protein
MSLFEIREKPKGLIVKSEIPMIKLKSHEDLRTKFHF